MRSAPPLGLHAYLELLRSRGELPLQIERPLLLSEVAAWALELPPVTGEGTLELAGYAIMPPHGQGPLVRLRNDVRALDGTVTRAGQCGVVGAVWRSRLRVASSAVVRLWMRPDGGDKLAALVPLDVYESDIGAEVVPAGLSAVEHRQRTSWYFAYLTAGHAEG